MHPYTAGKDAPEDSEEHRLYLWVQEMHELMDHLHASFAPQDWKHDYTSASATALEKRLITYCTGENHDRDATRIEVTAAYFGEVLLNEAGGRWGWDNNAGEGPSGLPVILPDPPLDLAPIVPLELAHRALAKRTGKVMAAEIRRVRKAVYPHYGRTLESHPPRLPTPRVESHDLEAVTFRMAMDDWLGQCMRDFRDGWIEEAGYGDREFWAFTPASLDQLEAILRDRCPTLEAFNDVCSSRFWTVAAWYVGMVVTEEKAATWQYRAIDPEAAPGSMYAADDYWTGSIFVNQRDRIGGHAEHPIDMLRAVLRDGVSLRQSYDRFPAPHLPE
ncbi:hypothetical protein [Streptomyces sp. NPDC048196]|uniref:hypothetical protein n=1 Tax=Streptomyces sp. NPDC048196 TaxID=3154712 RepID=UPI0033D2E216